MSDFICQTDANLIRDLEEVSIPRSRGQTKEGFPTARFVLADLCSYFSRGFNEALKRRLAAYDDCVSLEVGKRQKLADELAHAQSVVQDMTAVIAAKCEQERTLAEQIAQAIGPMLDTDTSDMELPELVGALIDFALGEHARAQVMSMEPEEAPGVFLVLNADGRITGPVHDTEKKAREFAAQAAELRPGGAFTVARRIAHGTTRVAIDWKEG